MKKYFLILLIFVCVKSNAQKDSAAQMSDTADDSQSMRIKFYSVLNDSMRLNVLNANKVIIEQYKDRTLVTIYPFSADNPKNKIDTTIIKHK